MERELLACALHSRQDYDLIVQYTAPKSAAYSKEFQTLFARVGDYYGRDEEASSVNADVLTEQIRETVRSEKLADRLLDRLREAVTGEASIPNVRDVILSAQRQEAADKLAAALADGDHAKAADLLTKYQELVAKTVLEEAEDDDVMVQADVAALLVHEYDPTNVIPLYPKSLNDRLDGGAKKGHHVTVFARPNMGKTAFTVSLGSGAARHGKRVMHLINEDRKEDVYIRYVSNLSGMDKHSIRDDPKEAERIARENGLDNVIVINIKPGTPEQIRHYIQKYLPDIVIVDQLRNLQVKADSRVNQLEAAATAMRNLGKQENVLMVSVTQAGDSAREKLILDDGDIDFSNTGIPAQADLLIGIGADPDHDSRGLRVLSLIKNKIGAIEDHFPTKINKTLSRYTSV